MAQQTQPGEVRWLAGHQKLTSGRDVASTPTGSGPKRNIGRHFGVTRYISVVSLTAIDDLGRVMAQAA
jgi:hypothetical protein